VAWRQWKDGGAARGGGGQVQGARKRGQHPEGRDQRLREQRGGPAQGRAAQTGQNQDGGGQEEPPRLGEREVQGPHPDLAPEDPRETGGGAEAPEKD